MIHELAFLIALYTVIITLQYFVHCNVQLGNPRPLAASFLVHVGPEHTLYLSQTASV